MKTIHSSSDCRAEFIPTIRILLEEAFDWDSTDEGMEYWLEVWEALERIAQHGR